METNSSVPPTSASEERKRFSTLECGVKIDDDYVDVKIYIISAKAESRRERGEKIFPVSLARGETFFSPPPDEG